MTVSNKDNGQRILLKRQHSNVENILKIGVKISGIDKYGSVW